MAQQHDIDQYHTEVVAMQQRCDAGAKKAISQYEYPAFVASAIRERWRLKYEHGVAILKMIYGVEDE